jgi:RNA polymerase sigma-70 factor, ECF subfamily
VMVPHRIQAPDVDQRESFEAALLPHLDAAYNLARWLSRDAHGAEDLVQEAFLRAWRFFDHFDGINGRVWLLTIVRNTCYSWLRKHGRRELTSDFTLEAHAVPGNELGPEEMLLLKEQRELLGQSLEQLPVEYREVMILRELEGLTYREIAEVAGIAVGTVMSRLSRGREQLKQILRQTICREG